jgi:hypothetical protein
MIGLIIIGIIMFLILFIFLLFISVDFPLKISTASEQQNKEDIDIVISWGGTEKDIEVIQERERWLNEYNMDHNSREVIYYREIEKCIDSIHKYAPWIRTIYILKPKLCKIPFDITDDIVLIDQEDIVPEPVFNSHAIETQLDKIPGLSNYFIYACDDMYFFSEMKKDDFFINGKALLTSHSRKLTKNKSLHSHAWQNNLKLLTEQNINTIRPFHHLIMLHRDSFNIARKLFSKEWKETSLSKFRNEKDIHPVGLVLNIMNEKGTGVFKENGILSTDFSIGNLHWKNKLKRNWFILTKQLQKSKLLCLNDNTTSYKKKIDDWIKNKF